MTADKAREILQNWWYNKCRYLGDSATLPIDDEVVYADFKDDTQKVVEQFSFRYLIGIAYPTK